MFSILLWGSDIHHWSWAVDAHAVYEVTVRWGSVVVIVNKSCLISRLLEVLDFGIHNDELSIYLMVYFGHILKYHRFDVTFNVFKYWKVYLISYVRTSLVCHL